MINDIILLTACLKIENLFDIAKSIKENMAKTTLNVIWAISIDAYNSDNDKVQKLIPELDALLEEYGINHVFFLSGKPNQKNYGGDMFNKPLIELKKTMFKNKNAFVYILDDDNIIHPFLFDRLNRISEFNCDNDRIYVLTCVGEYGEVCESYKDAFMREVVNGKHYFVPYQLALDPSQALHTLNFIMNWEYVDANGKLKKGKMFPSESTYDVNLYYFLAKKNRDCFVCYDEIDGPKYFGIYRNSFHNGLRTKKDIEEYIDSLKESKLSSSYIVVQTNDKEPKMFPITKEIAEMVLSELKEMNDKKSQP